MAVHERVGNVPKSRLIQTTPLSASSHPLISLSFIIPSFIYNAKMSSGNRPRPPSLNLLTSSSPARPISTSASTTHRQSESPFRYVRFHHNDVNEKLLDETPLSDLNNNNNNNNNSSSPHPSSTPPTTSGAKTSHHRTARSNSPPSALTAGHRSPLFLRQPVSPHPIRPRSLSLTYTYPRGLRLANLVRPWTPIILYAITSIGFLIAIAFWKTEVFTGESPIFLFAICMHKPIISAQL